MQMQLTANINIESTKLMIIDNDSIQLWSTFGFLSLSGCYQLDGHWMTRRQQQWYQPS
jgi:hypothetical protein